MHNPIGRAIAATIGRVTGFDEWFFENVLYFCDADGRQRQPGPIERWQAWWHFAAEHAAESGEAARALAATQGFVVTTSQAAASGVSRARARTRVQHGEWLAPRHSVLAPIDIRGSSAVTEDATIDGFVVAAQDGVPHDAPDRWLLDKRRCALGVSAAALCNPHGVVSGLSAAVLHGFPTFRTPEEPALTMPGATTAGRRGAVHGYQAGLHPAEVCDWFGARVTTASRTLVDLARHNRRDAIIAADAALHEAVVTVPQLRRALMRAAGWPGVRQARAVLELADPLAESPLESLVRLALHDSGFPRPRLQVPIAVSGRQLPYRVDFLWPHRRLVLEADGRLKYSDKALWREKRRERALRKLGYRVERVVWADVLDDWPAVCSMLAEALA